MLSRFSMNPWSEMLSPCSLGFHFFGSLSELARRCFLLVHSLGTFICFGHQGKLNILGPNIYGKSEWLAVLSSAAVLGCAEICARGELLVESIKRRRTSLNSINCSCLKIFTFHSRLVNLIAVTNTTTSDTFLKTRHVLEDAIRTIHLKGLRTYMYQ